MRRSRILLLALGGTIACRPSRAGLVPRLRGDELVAAVRPRPGIQVDARDPMKRTTLSPDDWVSLSEQLWAARQQYDGFVVTLGTDTLAHTACALSLMLHRFPRPVLLTGAMAPIIGASAGAARRNLRAALTVAASDAPGVFVVFAGKLIDGSRASKVRTDQPDAFDSINAPPLATVGPQGIRWARRPPAVAGRPRLRSALERSVALVQLFPTTTPADIKPLARHAGIVVAGYGDGNIPDELVPALTRLAAQRVVVLASQCPYGTVHHRYAGGAALRRAGAWTASDLSLEMSCVKLMWALGQSRTRAGARRQFHGR